MNIFAFSSCLILFFATDSRYRESHKGQKFRPKFRQPWQNNKFGQLPKRNTSGQELPNGNNPNQKFPNGKNPDQELPDRNPGQVHPKAANSGHGRRCSFKKVDPRDGRK